MPGRYPVRFGTAELIRDADRANAWLLSVDGVAQSYVDLDTPANLEFDYVRRFGDVVDQLPPGPVDALHIGGAACTLPRYVAATRPGSRQLVFDADGELVDLVRAQLGLRLPGLRVRITDGRTGLATRREDTADLVVVDAFERATLAGGLATLEATRAIAEILRAPGIYLANITDGSGLPFARRFLATLREVFPEVLALADPAVLKGRRFGNLVFAASAAPLPTAEIDRRTASAAFPARCVSGAELRKLAGRATPITDADLPPSPQPPEDVLGLF
ncbi:spermidine synthase-like protein [Amycolatopsis eburnea]|uniref:Spermidine synthase-like protein n=1 Tax=Amycolatopsis eburnea TaxID=2267691 RepID=A0A427TD31_9PSEU|nr:fused MFS/spermidine synthase [Amycolatopsis eburnea]RSD20334.1 spermidine synthase-like protein [Amycolatopsis eburnea]